MHDPSALDRPPQGYLQYQGPPKWSPYVTYPPGAVIWYAGTYWRCEGGHTSGSEPSGVPTNNLHLWTPISSTSQMPAHHHAQSFPSGPSYQYQQFSYPSSSSSSSNPPYYGPPSHFPPSDNEKLLSPPKIIHEDSSDSNSSGETVTATSSSMKFFSQKATESFRYLAMREEEHKAKDKDELKDELKGKRIWRIGGVGIFSYSLEEEQERRKAGVWKEFSEKHGRAEWVEAAKERTKVYSKDSKVKPLMMWKFVAKGEYLPSDALAIGHESDGQLLYAARAWFEGGLHLGKASGLRNASLSYGGAEHLIDEFEVLCAPSDSSVVKWMNFRHGERTGVQGWLPVEGGREKDGQALLIAKGEYDNGQHPGKSLIGDDHACIGWGGGELWIRPFQILAYSDPNRR